MKLKKEELQQMKLAELEKFMNNAIKDLSCQYVDR